MSKSRAIEQYIATGEVDATWAAWSGDAVAGGVSMRRILERILFHRANGSPLGRRVVPVDAGTVLVERVRPMVQGLFGADEAAAILASLPRCLEVVTVSGFADQVAVLSLDDAWCLANIVLEDMGAPPLSDGAPQLDGLCLGHQMWVPPGAFAPPKSTADVLVHEVAHLLHTVPCTALGLDGEGPPLPVPAVHHETFAYSCELLACMERLDPVPEDWTREVVDMVYMADARVDIAALKVVLARAKEGGWAAVRAWQRSVSATSR